MRLLSSQMTGAGWLAVLAVVLSACGGPLAQVTADRADYWAYRRMRTARTIDARLGAAVHYLRDHPRGRWQQEVRRWFDANEPAYFRRVGPTIGGMRRYLAALPEGPHAESAADRLQQLERAKELRRRREAAELAGARAVGARMVAAARARDALIHALGDWTRRVASITSWGGRTSELDHEFIFHYRLEKPEAHCGTWRCTKALSFDYSVPEGTGLVRHRALFDVGLSLRDGGVASAEISGPELFTRVGEALLVRPIAPDDISGRIEALGRVADLVTASVESRLPTARCARSPTSPIVVERQCDGLRMRMIAATRPEDDDRIVVEPVTAK